LYFVNTEESFYAEHKSNVVDTLGAGKKIFLLFTTYAFDKIASSKHELSME
jgi:hypothetical protein